MFLGIPWEYREAENTTRRKKNRNNRRPTAGKTTGGQRPEKQPEANGWKYKEPWPMAQGPGPRAQGPWPMAHGPRPMAHGPWPMAQKYITFSVFLHELALERCYEALDRSELKDFSFSIDLEGFRGRFIGVKGRL